MYIAKYRKGDEELDEPAGPTLRSQSQNKPVGDPVAEAILAKKVTRKQIYYQVIAKYIMYIHVATEHEMCKSRTSGIFEHFWG